MKKESRVDDAQGRDSSLATEYSIGVSSAVRAVEGLIGVSVDVTQRLLAERAMLQAQKLESLGYTNLRDLGGILSWPYEIEGDFEGHF